MPGESGVRPDPTRVSLRLGLQPFRDPLRFTGRSTIAEVGSFMLVCGLIWALVVAAIFTLVTLNPSELSPAAKALILAAKRLGPLVYLPLPALLARRLHDQDRSGWLILVPILLHLGSMLGFQAYIAAYPDAAVYSSPLGGFHVSSGHWTPALALLAAAEFAVAPLLLAASFLPPRPGPNRYGPDPRLDPA